MSSFFVSVFGLMPLRPLGLNRRERLWGGEERAIIKLLLVKFWIISSQGSCYVASSRNCGFANLFIQMFIFMITDVCLLLDVRYETSFFWSGFHLFVPNHLTEVHIGRCGKAFLVSNFLPAGSHLVFSSI